MHNNNFLMFIGNGFTQINSFFTCERTWQITLQKQILQLQLSEMTKYHKLAPVPPVNKQSVLM